MYLRIFKILSSKCGQKATKTVIVNYTKAPWLHEREKTFKSAPREQVNGQTKACKEKLDDVLVFNDCVILVIIYEKLIFLAK